MADQKVTELPIKGTSGINLADYLFGIDSAEGYQMLISDLAKKIVEEYSGSSVAGSAQTLKVALDGIANTKGNKAIWVDMGTVSSLPVTKTASGITTDMVVSDAVLGTPAAQTGNWTVNTDTAGRITVSGSISGSTTLKLLMVPQNSVSAS